MNKESKSARIQLLFFTLIPNIIVYLAAALWFVDVPPFITIRYVLTVIGLLWTAISGFVIAANMSVINKIGEPSQPVLKIKASATKLDAAIDMQFSPQQSLQFIINVFFTVIFAVPVAAFGWLLFILYCKGKFLKKLSTMAADCDRANELIAQNSAKEEDLAYYFYRMLDYVNVYKRLGEKKGAGEMIDRAEKLLDCWERQYGEN